MPSLVGCGLPASAAVAFARVCGGRVCPLRGLPRLACRGLPRLACRGLPSLGGSVFRGLAVVAVFLRPVPVCPCPPPLGGACGGRLRRPPLRGSSCPRSPLILLETSQTFYKFRALAAAAAPRPSSVRFGRGRRRSACARRPLRLFVPAQRRRGFSAFGFRARKKARKKVFCGKSVEKFQKIPKMSIFRRFSCQKWKNV